MQIITLAHGTTIKGDSICESELPKEFQEQLDKDGILSEEKARIMSNIVIGNFIDESAKKYTVDFGVKFGMELHIPDSSQLVKENTYNGAWLEVD